jgi:hypothetical protein
MRRDQNIHINKMAVEIESTALDFATLMYPENNALLEQTELVPQTCASDGQVGNAQLLL